MRRRRQQYKVWPGVYVPHFHFKNQAPSLRTDGARGSIDAGRSGSACERRRSCASSSRP